MKQVNEASFGSSLKESEELQGKQKSIERDIDSYKSQVLLTSIVFIRLDLIIVLSIARERK